MRALSRAATVAAVAFAATPLFRAFLYKLCILVNYRLGVSPHVVCFLAKLIADPVLT